MSDRNPTRPPAGPPERLYRLPSWLFNHLAGPANRLVLAHLDPGGPQRVDYALLSCLAEDGPHSQAELSRRIGIDRSDIVALVNGLESAGLAVRARDERDRRRNAVSLTAAGRRTLAAVERRVGQAQEELLAPLDAQERAKLVSLMQRLVDHHHGSFDAGSARSRSRSENDSFPVEPPVLGRPSGAVAGR